MSLAFQRLASRCTASMVNSWKANSTNPLSSRIATTLFPQHSSVSLQQSRSLASKKHKNLLKHAKGYRGRSKNCFRIAIRRVHKAWQYAYRDRRRKKREWRKLWIMRIQAGVRQYNWQYSRFIAACQSTNIQLNRKVLSELAANEPFAFKSVVDVVENQNKAMMKH